MSQNQCSEIVEKCTKAIIESKNMEILNKLTVMPTREWCVTLNRLGNTLLQESIRCYNTEAFDFLLKFQDLVSLEIVNVFGKTALMFALDVHSEILNPEKLQTLEYFAAELIKFGAYIHGVYKNQTFLDKASALSFIKVSELLLERGIDVNFEDDIGNTSLHKILYHNPKKVDELVPLLLAYGADPFIENLDGFIPFEYAVKYDNELSVQEILFYYTFDEHTDDPIDAGILFKLAQTNHQLFSELSHNNKVTFVVKYVHDIRELIDIFDHLVEMDIERLRILVNNHSTIIKKLIIKIITYYTTECILQRNSEPSYLERLKAQKKKRRLFRAKYGSSSEWKCLTSNNNIENLSVLFESKIKTHMRELLFFATPYLIFQKTMAKNNQAETFQLLTFLLSYGLTFTKTEYDEVYLTYGYCELFKLMLMIGSDGIGREVRSPMCRFICDINFDMETLFSTGRGFISCKNMGVLLDYFANSKLTKYVLDFAEAQIGDGKVELLARIAVQPTVPSLVELSRDIFRRYVIEKFQVKNESRFYSIIRWLPIESTHKNIITYETKLYNV